MGDPNEPCARHELAHCAECRPPAKTYQGVEWRWMSRPVTT